MEEDPCKDMNCSEKHPRDHTTQKADIDEISGIKGYLSQLPSSYISKQQELGLLSKSNIEQAKCSKYNTSSSINEIQDATALLKAIDLK